MLTEYFSIKFQFDESGEYLTHLPRIIDEIPPYIDGLPLFMLRLGTNVSTAVYRQLKRTLRTRIG